MIVDTHVHLFPPEIIRDWEKIAEREPHFGDFVRAGGRVWESAGGLLDAMDEDGVEESWICGFGFGDLGLCRACNEYAEASAAESGGRLKWLCVVPPMARGAGEEIAHCASRGAIGVGEISPVGQCWHIDEVRETWRVVGACHESGLYILLSAGGRDGPSDAYAFARNHPEAVIVMAGWGGGLFLRESAPEERIDLKNVYYDTATAHVVYDSPIFEAAFRVAPHKILYGSGFPLMTLPGYKKMIDETDMSSEDVDSLFFRNACGLLELLPQGGWHWRDARRDNDKNTLSK